MRKSDISELLRDAAAVPSTRVSTPGIIQGAKRLRRRRFLTAGGFILAILVTAVLGITTLRPLLETDQRTFEPGGSGLAPEPSPTDSWVTFHSSEHGFTVSFPNDWHRATDVLADQLVEPYEVLSLGTFPLVPGGDEGDCGPGNAVEDVGSENALIWLIESPREGTNSADSEFPPRPDDFASFHEKDDFSSGCIRSFPIYGGAFSDAGRDFHVYVVFGSSVNQELARTTWDVLNTLQFESRN